MTQAIDKTALIIDFAPKAIATIISCQNILAEYIVPNSGITERECINRLLTFLDDKELVISINQIKERVTPKSTGEVDKNGLEIFEDDGLLLSIETIRMVGVAKYSEATGEWELYKDEGNHVGIAHNRHLITKI